MQTCMQGKGGRSNAIEGFPRTGSRPRITALIDQAPILRKETWPERFATHLLVLRPQLTALEAASVAADEYEELCDFEPEVAAAMYADDSTDI